MIPTMPMPAPRRARAEGFRRGYSRNVEGTARYPDDAHRPDVARKVGERQRAVIGSTTPVNPRFRKLYTRSRPQPRPVNGKQVLCTQGGGPADNIIRACRKQNIGDVHEPELTSGI